MDLLGLSLAFTAVAGELQKMSNFFEDVKVARLGESILEEVRNRHGNPNVGHVPLSPAYEARKVREGGPANSPLLWTGQTRDSFFAKITNDPSGDGKALVIGSNEDTALWDELGTDHSPPRPVLLPSVYAKHDEVIETFGNTIVGLFERIFGGGPINQGGGYYRVGLGYIKK